jgi:diacylglycerol kinase family enzyme
VPLGIIPLGTLNHFARDLRIPVLANRAVAVIASGEQRYVDVGEINGKIFINNSSIGIYPYLVLLVGGELDAVVVGGGDGVFGPLQAF